MTLGNYSCALPVFLVPFCTLARIPKATITKCMKIQRHTRIIPVSFYSTNTSSSSQLSTNVITASHLTSISAAAAGQDPSKGHLVRIGQWSPWEDNTLCKSVKHHGTSWLQVASGVQQRAPEQCAARWNIINESEQVNESSTNDASTASNNNNNTTTAAAAAASTFNVRRRRAINYWSKEEDARLCAAAEEYGMEWAKVAKLFPGRSQNSCRSRWYFSTASTIKRGYWTSEEDALLAEAVNAHPYGEWARVALEVPGRTDRQCRRRWVEHLASSSATASSSSTSSSNTIRRGRKTTWTEEESERLKRLVAEYGFLWTTIARHMGSRTPTQCRDRWRSSMTPGIKSGHWTEEEDELLRQGVKQYNRRWKMVASMIPGRTPRQCSARWNAAIDPTYNFSKWSPEEDEQLMSAVLSVPGDSNQLGFDWESCSKYLKYKRSARQCRHRYRCLERIGRVNIGQEKESFSSQLYRSFLSEQYSINVHGNQLDSSNRDDDGNDAGRADENEEKDWDLLADDLDIDLDSLDIDESLFLNVANE